MDEILGTHNLPHGGGGDLDAENEEFRRGCAGSPSRVFLVPVAEPACRRRATSSSGRPPKPDTVTSLTWPDEILGTCIVKPGLGGMAVGAEECQNTG
jgi:hypothetical protein